MCGERNVTCGGGPGGGPPLHVNIVARDVYRLCSAGSNACGQSILKKFRMLWTKQERDGPVEVTSQKRLRRTTGTCYRGVSWGRCLSTQHMGPFSGEYEGESGFWLSFVLSVTTIVDEGSLLLLLCLLFSLSCTLTCDSL